MLQWVSLIQIPERYPLQHKIEYFALQWVSLMLTITPLSVNNAPPKDRWSLGWARHRSAILCLRLLSNLQQLTINISQVWKVVGVCTNIKLWRAPTNPNWELTKPAWCAYLLVAPPSASNYQKTSMRCHSMVLNHSGGPNIYYFNFPTYQTLWYVSIKTSLTWSIYEYLSLFISWSSISNLSFVINMSL